MVRISEFQELEDDSMERVNLNDYHVGGRHPSERRSITTALGLEVEAPFADGSKNKNTKFNAIVTAYMYSMSHQ